MAKYTACQVVNLLSLVQVSSYRLSTISLPVQSVTEVFLLTDPDIIFIPVRDRAGWRGHHSPVRCRRGPVRSFHAGRCVRSVSRGHPRKTGVKMNQFNSIQFS